MIKCCRGTDGLPYVDVFSMHPSVKSFLEQDVESSTRSCHDYLQAAADVEEGRMPQWSGTGNAHTVTIRPSGVTIENVWDPSQGLAKLSINEFKQCLQVWLECISR